jgi:hypothetical protein
MICVRCAPVSEQNVLLDPGQARQRPTIPLHRAPPSTGHTPPPRKLPSRNSLGENLTLASKSGSEVTFLTQDDQNEHFWLNGISLRGQAAELDTSAGLPSRFSIALLCENQARLVQPGRIHNKLVWGKS